MFLDEFCLKITRETMILGHLLNKNVYLCRIKREYFIEWN